MTKFSLKAKPIVTLEQLVDKIAEEETIHSKWDISNATIAYILLFITLILVYFHLALEIVASVVVFGLFLIWLKAWEKRGNYTESHMINM